MEGKTFKLTHIHVCIDPLFNKKWKPVNLTADSIRTICVS